MPSKNANQPELLHETIAEELRYTTADYRMLALHAGPMHHITLEAKRRIIQLTAMLESGIDSGMTYCRDANLG